MRIHFIGLGERIMSDLAISLSQQGHKITGSDVAFSPSPFDSPERRTLTPEQAGWFPKKIQPNLDRVIVGRQIYIDNPELQAAKQLDLPICSYPEYICDYAQDKQRIVIVGGEEEKLLCSLVLHVLGYLHRPFDYVVDSSKLKASVQLSDAPIIIFEGDVDPSSCVDSRPQSLCYQHNIVLISSVGWKKNNTYPTLETYLAQVTKLADASPKGGTLLYYKEDSLVNAIGSSVRTDIKTVPYQAPPHRYEEQQVYLVTPQKGILLKDKMHSLRAVAGAQELLRNLAISDQQFYEAVTTFFVN